MTTEEPITCLGIAVTAEAVETDIRGECCLTLNCPEGHAHLLACLARLPVAPRIVCEEAGGAETALVRTLRAAGFTVGVVVSEKVCASARLHDASEITPGVLVRYAAAHPDAGRFIEGSATPNRVALSAASWFRPVVARRANSWQRIARWFGHSRAPKPRRAAGKDHAS